MRWRRGRGGEEGWWWKEKEEADNEKADGRKSREETKNMGNGLGGNAETQGEEKARVMTDDGESRKRKEKAEM